MFIYGVRGTHTRPKEGAFSLCSYNGVRGTHTRPKRGASCSLTDGIGHILSASKIANLRKKKKNLLKQWQKFAGFNFFL